MRVLITGGSGYLGTHVRSFFQAEDFSRRSHLDMLSPLDATRMSAYEVVIHLAAHLSKNPADAEECFRTNVEGTVNLLREMQPNSVFIFARSGTARFIRAASLVSGRQPLTCCSMANSSAMRSSSNSAAGEAVAAWTS